MKKFYETPAVEFTGFNAEDVITTSIVDTMEYGTNDAVTTKVDNSITATKAGLTTYNSYNW